MKKILLLVIIMITIVNCYASTSEEVNFSKCVDGDTAKFIINNEEKVVRFLAIDAPESVKPESEVELFGKEASEYTCNRLKEARKIVLEYDDKSDKIDKFDRVLAFVYVDESLLEKELIEKGLAKVAYVYDDYKHINELRESEKIAKQKKIGIWSDIALGDEVSMYEEKNFFDIVFDIMKNIWSFIIKIFA